MNPIFNTLFVGKVFSYFETLPSTNIYAIELLSHHKPSDGTIIFAAAQTQGRGQMGNSWECAPYQNVALSIILYPSFLNIRKQFLLNQAISLAVRDALLFLLTPTKANDFDTNNTNLKIKWPNDIYVKDNKIGGILIQNILSGQIFQAAIVGIGLNVNQTIFLSNAPNPTSLALEFGKEIDIQQVIEKLGEAVEARYLQLRAGNIAEIQQTYLTHLYRYQTLSTYQRTADALVFQGIIRGISDIGELLIEHEGKIEKFDLKQIKFLPNN